MAFNVGTAPITQPTVAAGYLRYTNLTFQTASPEEIQQPTVAAGYLRYTNLTFQTASPEEIQQPTVAAGYLRYTNLTFQTASPEEIQQPTVAAGYLRYTNLTFQTASPYTIEQSSRIYSFLYFRPFIPSNANLLPLYQVTPKFSGLPISFVNPTDDGFPGKDIPSGGGPQTETKLMTTESFIPGTNEQGVPNPDIVSEWGKLYTVIDKQDVSSFRDAEPIITTISWSMVGNYETLEVIIPGATSFDTKETLPWLYSGAQIEIYKEKDNAFDILWRGSINGWTFEDNGLGLRITANGLLYDLTYQVATPQKGFDSSKDVAHYIRQIVNEGKQKWNYMPAQTVGSTTSTKANYESELEYIKKLGEESSTTLWVNEYDIPKIVAKDERLNTNILGEPINPSISLPNKTVRYLNGQDGLVDNLSLDEKSEANVIYKTGSYPAGGRWVNWNFPQIEGGTYNQSMMNLYYSIIISNIPPESLTSEVVLAFPLPDIDDKIKVGTSDTDTMKISEFPSTLDKGGPVVYDEPFSSRYDRERLPAVNVVFIEQDGTESDIDIRKDEPPVNNPNGIVTLQYLIAWYMLGPASYWSILAQNRYNQFPSLRTGQVGTFQESDAENIRTIQRQNGLPITGEVDIKTWSVLCGKIDLSSDAWIAPAVINLHPDRGRLNEVYEDIGIATKTIGQGLQLSQEEYQSIIESNKPVGGQINTAITPAWLGEIELTLCPPIVEGQGQFGSGEISRFDIRPRDIIELWYHPGSYKFYLESEYLRYLDLFITRVEWDLSAEPKVKLQVATKPFDYTELVEYIYPDL